MQTRNTLVANPEGLSASTVLASFGEWLDARVAEAVRLGMDLSFRDCPFDIVPGRSPALVGWEHRFVAPGAAPPRGKMWTTYRLQDQAPRESAPRRRRRLADRTPLVDTVGCLGVFDGEPAFYSDAARR